MAGRAHVVDWACEALGTAALLLGGLSAVVLDFGHGSPVAGAVPSTSLRLLLTGALFAGTGALVTVSPVGRRSGAHLNPAVSLAFFAEGHLDLADLVGYVVAQCLGAVGGTVALVVAWGTSTAGSVHDGLTLPGEGLSPLAAAGVEALMTALLVLTIFVFVSSPRTAKWTPLAVWVVITVLVWQGAPYTGTSLNPARSLGPALVTGRWTRYWAYLVGPLVGAGAAVACWRLTERTTLTAKLFHDARYRSALHSLLPVKR